MFNRIISLGDSVTRTRFFFLQNKPNTLTNTIYNMNIERFVCSVTFFLNLSTLHRCPSKSGFGLHVAVESARWPQRDNKKNHKIIANPNANPAGLLGLGRQIRFGAR